VWYAHVETERKGECHDDIYLPLFRLSRDYKHSTLGENV
jgi:hypothetical protein